MKLDAKVEAGQKLAIQRNSFGEVVAEYTSSVAGEVTGQRSDAMAEPGNPLAFILFQKPAANGGQSYPMIVSRSTTPHRAIPGEESDENLVLGN